MGRIVIKRIYVPPEPADGFRILVDCLWPRGISKQRAHLDLWLKEITPSPELRIWFDHDPARFALFREKYRAELDAMPEIVAEVATLAKSHDITLLYAARDPHVNHVIILMEYLQEQGIGADGRKS